MLAKVSIPVTHPKATLRILVRSIGVYRPVSDSLTGAVVIPWAILPVVRGSAAITSPNDCDCSHVTVPRPNRAIRVEPAGPRPPSVSCRGVHRRPQPGHPRQALSLPKPLDVADAPGHSRHAGHSTGELGHWRGGLPAASSISCNNITRPICLERCRPKGPAGSTNRSGSQKAFAAGANASTPNASIASSRPPVPTPSNRTLKAYARQSGVTSNRSRTTATGTERIPSNRSKGRPRC